MKEVILAILLTLAPYHKDTESKEDRDARLDVIATAIATASEDKARIAAFLIMTANAETHLAKHIHEGICKEDECDDGKAFSLWQFWRLKGMTDKEVSSFNGTDIESTTLSAKFAARLFTMKRNYCKSDYGAINAYGSGKCGAIPNSTERLATMRRYQGWIEGWMLERKRK